MPTSGLTGIQVEGLQRTLRAFGRIQKGLRQELRKELIQIAGVVAAKARDIAEQKGLHDSGSLIERIHPGMRASYAYITDTAKRKSAKYPAGFNYPAIYEYGGSQTRKNMAGEFNVVNRSRQGAALALLGAGSQRHVGPRAFLEPALAEREEWVVKAIDAMLGRMTSQAGFGNGGLL